MAYLERFARKKKEKEKLIPTSIKLPESTLTAFKKYCDELGMSVTEAIYLLVDRELSEVGNVIDLQQNTAKEEVTASIQEEVQSSKVVIRSNTKKIQKNTGSGRFVTTEYTVNEELPCPICKSWYSRVNFSRHAKSHNMTTQDILEGNLTTVLEMIAKRKETTN